MAKDDTKRRALKIATRLAVDYADATCALRFRTPLELLVATILSAQCTDERVNKVTVDLFKKYRSAEDYARAEPAELENDIRTTGFFRNKTKSIQGCCRKLVQEHGGQVPREMEKLIKLPGVGRKTANVVLGTAYGIPAGVVVDTHVTRLARRMGLTRQNDAIKIEAELMDLLPESEWIDFAHRMIWHGRKVCTARKPDCDACTLAAWCPRIGVASGGKRRK
jgi:endonuclease-3